MLVIDLEVISQSSFVEHFVFNGQDIMFVQIHMVHRILLEMTKRYFIVFLTRRVVSFLLAQVAHRRGFRGRAALYVRNVCVVGKCLR